VVNLGGGRNVESDRIDPSVGISQMLGVGAKVARGQPLCTLHAADEDSAEAAALAIRNAVTIGDAPKATPLVLERVDG